jgi:hypothetical protein
MHHSAGKAAQDVRSKDRSRTRSTDSLHGNDHSITAEAQHQASPFRLQVHNDTLVIMQPKIARTRVTDDDTVAALSIGSCKVRKFSSLVAVWNG